MDPIKKLYERLQQNCVDKVYQYYKPTRNFRCSESSNCVRQLWYRLSGYRPAPRTPVGEVYGICGDLDHDLTRQLFEFSEVPIHMVQTLESGEQVEGLLLDQTFPVEHNGETYYVRIRGRSDGEIDTDKGRNLLEIKGTGFWPYKYLQQAYDKSGVKGVIDRIRGTETEPAKHLQWYAQCQISMGLTGHKYTYLVVKDRSTGTLGFYKDDDNGDPDEATRTGVHLPFNQEFFDMTMQRFAYVVRKLEEGVPPAPEFTAGSKNCNQCDFFYRCHGAKDGKVVYPGPQLDMEPINEETMETPNVQPGLPGVEGGEEVEQIVRRGDGQRHEVSGTSSAERSGDSDGDIQWDGGDPNARYSE